jgi:hypothetical protein
VVAGAVAVVTMVRVPAASWNDTFVTLVSA